jgi:hypothetical protein
MTRLIQTASLTTGELEASMTSAMDETTLNTTLNTTTTS